MANAKLYAKPRKKGKDGKYQETEYYPTYPEVADRGLTLSAVHLYLSALNTPRALTVWLLYSNQEHLQLAELGIDPKGYTEKHVQKFARDYAATCLLKKADFLVLDVDPELEALKTLQETERKCRDTNTRLAPYCPNGCLDPGLLDPAIPAMQSIIKRVLGACDIEEILENAAFGPGTSTVSGREHTDAAYKFSFDSGITPDLFDLVGETLMSAFPPWEIWSDPIFIATNNVTTVLKNAKTNRSIASENNGNMFVQKGIGCVWKQRLFRHGINLYSQAGNQRLARYAMDRQLTTADFRNASGLVARRLPELLLPAYEVKSHVGQEGPLRYPRTFLKRDWFTLLHSCRAHSCTTPLLSTDRDGQLVQVRAPKRRGKETVYAKPVKTILNWEQFSSMGNGSTFELETLIFYAGAVASVKECGGNDVDCLDIGVYGDDVVLPSFAYPYFKQLMTKLGLEINETKSFDHGLFYESCGKHYFNGVDVTPIYLRTGLDTVADVYLFHNNVRRFAARALGCWRGVWGFKRLLRILRRSVPEDWDIKIPNGSGDGGFVSNFDEATPRCRRDPKTRKSMGWEGWSYHHIVDVPIRDRRLYRKGVLLRALTQIGVPDLVWQGNTTCLRDATWPKRKTGHVAQWKDLCEYKPYDESSTTRSITVKLRGYAPFTISLE